MDEQPDDSNWFDIQLSQNDYAPNNNRQDNFEEELINSLTMSRRSTTPILHQSRGLEDLDPEYQKLITLKYSRTQAVRVRSFPPAITTDAPTVEDPTDKIWHETSV